MKNSKKLRSLRNSKGWLRILEIALASALIFTFLVFIHGIQVSGSEASPSWDSAVLKNHAQDALLTLDNKDTNADGRSDLRTNILNNNWANIENDIDGILPAGTEYILYIDGSGGLVRKAGEQASALPSRRTIVTTYYPIAGDYGSFCNGGQPCALVLALWFNQ